jgi:hypothetical protein
MANSPHYPDTDDDAGMAPDRESTTGTPRWVKVSGIVVLVLVVLLAIVMLTGVGGDHGPGRHMLSDEGPGQQPPITVTEHGV